MRLSILELTQKSSKIGGTALEAPAQASATFMPIDYDVFSTELVAENVQVLRAKVNDDHHVTYMVTSEEVINNLKPKSTYAANIWITKDISGRLSILILAMNSRNTWTISKRESLEMGQKSPVFVQRDSDSKIYKPMQVTDVEVEEITKEDINKGLEAAFGEYLIQDVKHPALKGLLKKPAEIVDADDEVANDDAVTEVVSNELELDLDALDDFNILDEQ